MRIFTRARLFAASTAILAASMLAGCASTPSDQAGMAKPSVSPAAQTAQLHATPPIPTPATTPVRPTVTGPTKAYVPKPQSTLPVRALTSSVLINSTVSAKITKVEKVQVTAKVPGEVSGAALAVHVQLTNESPASVSLNGVTVEVSDHAGIPASPVSSSLGNAFSGSVGPKTSASAVYLFTVPPTKYNPVTIGVSYSNAAPLARFVGDVN